MGEGGGGLGGGKLEGDESDERTEDEGKRQHTQERHKEGIWKVVMQSLLSQSVHLGNQKSSQPVCVA